MKLLVVDDQCVLRTGLCRLLDTFEADTVVMEAESGERGLRRARDAPDLDAIFIDLFMPGMDRVTTMQEFHRMLPCVPVIVVSASEDPQDIRHALACGARGYLPTSASAHTIFSALRLVLSGDIYVPPLLFQATPVSMASRLDAPAPPPAGKLARLTERQLVVLRLLCSGLTNKAICCRLGLSEKTIKSHVSGIFKALCVINRTQATRAALDAGLIRLTMEEAPVERNRSTEAYRHF